MAHHGGRPALTSHTPLGAPVGASLGAQLVPAHGAHQGLGTPHGSPLGSPLGSPSPAHDVVPRVHRPLPTPPRTAPPTPPRPPRTPPASPTPPAPLVATEASEVSLSTPRPDGERRVNEYVETPLREGRGERGAARGASRCSPCRAKTVQAAPRAAPGAPRTTPRTCVPVRHQPTTFKKEPGAAVGLTAPKPGQGPGPSLPPRTSILCPVCGRCRCESCAEPRPLPSRWLCEDTCFCSAETAVDYATCLCCVKGLFYHCGGEEGLDVDGAWCADDPCSCSGGAGARRCARWSVLALASAFLPCLLCYWPLRGLVRATELCYARYCDDGCRCERRPPRTPNRPSNRPPITTPEKRLLDTD